MWWITHSSALYGGVLSAVFLLVGMWETYRPSHVHSLPTPKRWLLHCFLWLVTGATASLVFRGGAVALASVVKASPYGLLNRSWMPFGIRMLLAFLLLDLIQYLCHYLRHSIPPLWRLHQVHHADADVDLSTGIRFHPGDILFTQAVYLLTIAALAPPVFVVICFELCDIAQALFSHANIMLPPRIDRVLRLVLVSPEFHRIHHSRDVADQRSNLAVLFSFWDRLFHTSRDARTDGQPLRFGLAEVTPAQSVQPLAMLALPFVRVRAHSGESNSPFIDQVQD